MARQAALETMGIPVEQQEFGFKDHKALYNYANWTFEKKLKSSLKRNLTLACCSWFVMILIRCIHACGRGVRLLDPRVLGVGQWISMNSELGRVVICPRNQAAKGILSLHSQGNARRARRTARSPSRKQAWPSKPSPVAKCRRWFSLTDRLDLSTKHFRCQGA